MSQDNGTTEGFGDVEAQNMDRWARHPGGWAEQPADEAEDLRLDGEAAPFAQGMMPEGALRQRQSGGQGGQHPDQHSQGQGMTPGQHDSQGEEPYGRRGTPDEYEGTRDRSDVNAGNLGEEGRYGQEQPHVP